MNLIKVIPGSLPLLTSLAAMGLFLLCSYQLHESPPTRRLITFENVVIPAPVQVVIYGGDRFLAANIESARAVSANTALEANGNPYRIRAHQLVAQLNPCHEDNYWIGNAALSWAGSVDDGLELLHRAMDCRYWDEWPAFFYGFNQYFFNKNIDAARDAIEQAAQRSPNNYAFFRNFSIMLKAGEIDDARIALKMIEQERDQTSDPDLHDMLDARVMRLSGLIQLRDAQATYEARFGKPLEDATDLIATKILNEFPKDPLNLGYEYKDHTFRLRKIEIR